MASLELGSQVAISAEWSAGQFWEREDNSDKRGWECRADRVLIVATHLRETREIPGENSFFGAIF